MRMYLYASVALIWSEVGFAQSLKPLQCEVISHTPSMLSVQGNDLGFQIKSKHNPQIQKLLEDLALAFPTMIGGQASSFAIDLDGASNAQCFSNENFLTSCIGLGSISFYHQNGDLLRAFNNLYFDLNMSTRKESSIWGSGTVSTTDLVIANLSIRSATHRPFDSMYVLDFVPNNCQYLPE